MRPSKSPCPCRKCGGATIIKQSNKYAAHGEINHRYCKTCGHQWRNRVHADGSETYLGAILRRDPETMELRRRYKDMLFKLEHSDEISPEVLASLRRAGVRMGVTL